MTPKAESYKPTQKLTFFRQHTRLNEATRQNEIVDEMLFAEWADIRPLGAFKSMNGVQLEELGITHTVLTRWLDLVEVDMNCSRRIRKPDRSISTQTFRVISFEPFGQENRYMQVMLSEIKI